MKAMIAATQIARPEIVESAVLDKDGDGSIILVGYRNAPSTDDLAVDRNERQCGIVAQEDLAPYCGHDRCTPCRAGRSCIPLRHAARAVRRPVVIVLDANVVAGIDHFIHSANMVAMLV